MGYRVAAGAPDTHHLDHGPIRAAVEHFKIHHD
jgi:hypothetical protein